MFQGQYIFSQLTTLLPKQKFDDLVKYYEGNKGVRHFTCWNQLNCMVFGQLTSRESLRDLNLAIYAHKSKSYHMGFGKNVSLANFSNANAKRNYKIFEDFAFYLIEQTRKALALKEDFSDINTEIYAIDASIIDLCLDVFWWARFKETKAGLKLNVVHDIKTDIPAFIHISEAKEHDVKFLDIVVFEPGAFYILDRGYFDFSRLFRIKQNQAYFVIRAKKNTQYKRQYSIKKDPEQPNILSDQIVKFTGKKASNRYPDKIRKVRYYDPETDRIFIYLTNNFVLPAKDIAKLYKHRWSIELFFKWVKQHMKIKSFWGTNPNAVKIQIYSAVIGYCLVALARKNLNLSQTNYEILQVLSVSFFDKSPMNQLFTKSNSKKDNSLEKNQLKISFI